MEISQYVWVCVSLVLAFMAGYLLGKSVPRWEEDHFNDLSAGEVNLGAHGGLGGWGYHQPAGCAWLAGSLANTGNGVPIAVAMLAILLMYFFGWPAQNSDLHGDYAWFMLLFDRRFWMLLGAAFAGYAVATLTKW